MSHPRGNLVNAALETKILSQSFKIGCILIVNTNAHFIIPLQLSSVRAH